MIEEGYSNSDSIIVDSKATNDENVMSKDNIDWDKAALDHLTLQKWLHYARK